MDSTDRLPASFCVNVPLRSPRVRPGVVLAFVSMSVVAGVFPDEAEAQDARAESTAVQSADIIVTAQKRDERLLDVPVAVTAIKADTLISRNLVMARDYLAAVPGVQVNVRQAGRTQINIRGITTGNGGNPLVGIVIDDVPYGSSTVYGQAAGVFPDLDPSILSDVEVLRGPQGTLYGASTMGGLIKFQTRAPSLTQTSGAFQTGITGIDGGSLGYSFRGSLDTPILTDKWAIGASALYRRDSGYITDTASGRKNGDAVRTYGGRFAIHGQLTDTFTVRLTALVQDQRSDVSSQVDTDINGKPIDGDRTHRRLLGTDGFHSEVEFYSMVLDKQLGPLSLSSLTGYARTKLSMPTDLTLSGAGMASAATGLPSPGVFLDSRVTTKKWTQELRLSSDASEPLSFIGGLYFADERSYFYQDRYAVDKATGKIVSPTFFDVDLPSSFREYAAYATVTWKAAPQFDLIAGGRYSHNIITSSERDVILGETSATVGNAKENPTTFNVSARYHLSPNLMVYGRIASGYRAGGANAGPPAQTRPTYKSDSLVNYELGIKGRTIDGLLSGTLSAYYIDWSDIQVTQRDADLNSYVANAGKARSDGVEVAVDLAPARGLTLSGTVAFNDAVLTENPQTSTLYAFKGDRLPYSARWTATAGAQYNMPIRQNLSVFFGGNLLYTGQRLSDFVSSASQRRFNLPAYTTVDLHAGVDYGRWNLTFFVRNVGDSRGYLSGRPLRSNNAAPIAVSIVTPRTFGANLTTKF